MLNYKKKKMKINTPLKLCTIVGLLLSSINFYAQNKPIEQIEKETKEYIKYRSVLRAYKNNPSKSKIVPKPDGADPTTSLGSEMGNAECWRLYHKTLCNLPKSNKTITNTPVVIKEQAQPGETNNNFDDAQVIPNFGTEQNQIQNFTLSGALGESNLLGNPTILKNEIEDNHSFSRANFIDFEDNQAVKINGSLENLIKSETLSGDVDIFQFPIKEGSSYIFNIENNAENPNSLFALLFEGDGDALLGTFVFEESQNILYTPEGFTGNLTIALASNTDFSTAFRLRNPETVFPTADTAPYEIAAREIPNVTDLDFYSVQLKKGDVFGISGVSEFPLQMGLFGTEVGNSIAVENRLSIRSEERNPLPTEGEFGFHYVIPEDGEHLIFVRNGYGSYNLNVGVTRPGNEQKDSFGRQIIFLNMAGAELSLNEFFEGNNEDTRPRQLSPLSSFLNNWGLDEKRDLRRLAAKVTDKFNAKVDTEIQETGINPDANVLIISDFGDPRRRDQILNFLNKTEKPFSRLIVGGTSREFGTRTLGLSSAIDVGNFDLSDNGIVLLDELSSLSTTEISSINNIPVVEGIEKIDLVAEVLSNIAAHEAGHFLGCWHSDNNTNEISIMDQGGIGVFHRAGIFEDGVFGDENTMEVSFKISRYSRNEGSFLGFNETDTNVAFGLTTKRNRSLKQGDDFANFVNRLRLANNLPSILAVSSYPNPQSASETSTLIINAGADSNLNVSLFDLHGKKITDLYNGEVSGEQPLELEFNPEDYNLQSGIYINKVSSESGEKNHKIVIE